MEKHIALAKKIKELADKGIGGEKLNAEKMLSDLMKKHNITMADIEGEAKDDYFFKLTKDQFDLWYQLVKHVNYEIKVYGELPAKKVKELRLKGNYFITCTSSEYVEIEAKHDFYKKAYQKELEIFFNGFIYANKLTSSEPATEKVSEMSKEDREILNRSLVMAAGIKKQTFNKQLSEK